MMMCPNCSQQKLHWFDEARTFLCSNCKKQFEIAVEIVENETNAKNVEASVIDKNTGSKYECKVFTDLTTLEKDYITWADELKK